jgi:hypothetical protein
MSTSDHLVTPTLLVTQIEKLEGITFLKDKM